MLPHCPCPNLKSALHLRNPAAVQQNQALASVSAAPPVNLSSSHCEKFDVRSESRKSLLCLDLIRERKCSLQMQSSLGEEAEEPSY